MSIAWEGHWLGALHRPPGGRNEYKLKSSSRHNSRLFIRLLWFESGLGLPRRTGNGRYVYFGGVSEAHNLRSLCIQSDKASEPSYSHQKLLTLRLETPHLQTGHSPPAGLRQQLNRHSRHIACPHGVNTPSSALSMQIGHSTFPPFDFSSSSRFAMYALEGLFTAAASGSGDPSGPLVGMGDGERGGWRGFGGPLRKREASLSRSE